MDPNEALKMIREAATQDAQDMIEPFEALDEWLCKGGFLPDAWQTNPAVVVIQWDNGIAVHGPFPNLEWAANWITNEVSPTRKMRVLPLNLLKPSEYQEYPEDNDGG